ncbi:MAG: ATP-binding protein [Methanosarcinales archaeon]
MEMEIEFFNREEEIKEFKRIIGRAPRRIYFVYGPINSGKTALMQEIINSLTKQHKVFYYNLRRRVITVVNLPC